ncbi:sulfurtransferase [Conexibacter sp. CPCC 206217]|uniref:sulfurtransferase n=1 Tax=Conexibacter sp. CPCC 206217 TaxID=3064574 RepID=UPI002725E52A|nr:sulfurtransferase [Conexibacter sp. CPCC 206217]MDO8208816.1 sulfurtransferase [Conexibacter sp. CPCC 206217]
MSEPAVFVSIEALAEALASETPPRVLDVRFVLGRDDGPAAYAAGHIPGALYVDLPTDLASPTGPGTGSRPLPDRDTFAATVGSWGIDHDTRVVVYDDRRGLSAGRAWWLLKWIGLRDVELLDGDYSAWVAADLPTRGGIEHAAPAAFAAAPPLVREIDADGAAQLGARARLLDARTADDVSGKGRIPGARVVSTVDNVGGDGRLLPLRQLRERFAAVGATDGEELGVYCGGGVVATHEIAVLRHIGVDAALYPGSWSEWITDPSRPIDDGANDA